VRMGVQNQLATINAGFRIVASRPETANLPVVIGESDPDGCAACQSYKGLYPENGYRNGTLFASYTIEQLARTMDLAERNHVNLLGAVTWAFEFEDQPMFAGFRALATNGIAMPVCNTFRMLNKMGAKRLAVTSTGDLGLDAILGGGGRGGARAGGGQAADAQGAATVPARGRGAGGGRGGVRGASPDISALASRDERRVTIISWNYHDDDVAGPAGDITLNVSGIPAEVTSVKMTEWRIDETHSNSYTAWKQMGSPETLTKEQYGQLDAASALTIYKQPTDLPAQIGKAEIKVSLPRQAVSLIELTW
jgi:xylan 1,4-beta-xylosidase